MYINVSFRSRVTVSKGVEHPEYLLCFLLADAACLFVYLFIFLGNTSPIQSSALQKAGLKEHRQMLDWKG